MLSLWGPAALLISLMYCGNLKGSTVGKEEEHRQEIKLQITQLMEETLHPLRATHRFTGCVCVGTLDSIMIVIGARYK